MARSVHSTVVALVLFSLACATGQSGTPPASGAAPTEASAPVRRATPAPPWHDEGGADLVDTRMLAQPAISQEHIAFVYAGDLWAARLDGSDVRRLTTHKGAEGRPRFSPDGTLIAFSGQYDGNTDVFVVPVRGGVPKRLTWHPGADIVQDFTPDGHRGEAEAGRGKQNPP